MNILGFSTATICWCIMFASRGSSLLAEDGSYKVTINQQDNGYRGIWYINQPSGDEYVYRYSGGLGTYCAKHQPFAIYRPEVQRTFFCYGGTTQDNRA